MILLNIATSLAMMTAAAPASVDYAGDAKALDQLVIDNYAYEDHWPGGKLPDSPALDRERAAVHDHDSLLHYAEDRIASLADHHAITASSFKDSWAIVPTYADLWVVRKGNAYVIEAVKPGTPAAQAGIKAGDRLTAISGIPTGAAVDRYWQDMGLALTPERAEYAARVLAAGRRDRQRDLTIASSSGTHRLTLASLYNGQPDRPPTTVTREGPYTIIRLNNSLGEQDTIAAFDAAMAKLPPSAPLIVDLSDTPSGGNTSVARAIMSWFVRRPTVYQVHQLPSEERETGIARQWMEQVLPRAGKYHSTLPVVRVGRWTGSMGEGIAIGFAAFGARVEGTPMAQLKGAVYDFNLPSSGMVVKIPAERLFTVAGVPREDYLPSPQRRM